MECMFKGCKSLEKLDISEFNVSSVCHARNILKGCSSLREISAPAEWQIPMQKILEKNEKKREEREERDI